jgi:hypothetical protein
MAMNMRIDFDVFAAEVLDQIEAVQLLARALTPAATDVPIRDVDEEDRDAWRALAARAAALRQARADVATGKRVWWR